MKSKKLDAKKSQERKQITQFIGQAVRNVLGSATPEPKKVDVVEQQIRFQLYENNKALKLQKLKDEQESLLSKSQTRIVNKSFNGADFFERAQARKMLKEDNLKEKQIEAHEKQVTKELTGATFHPQVSKYANDKYKNRKRTGTDFYQGGIDWLMERANNLEIKKEKICEEKVEFPFKPVLNKKSNDLVKEDFVTRMQKNIAKQKQNLERIKKETTPTFKPQMQPTSSKINKSQISIQKENLNLDTRDIQNLQYASQTTFTQIQSAPVRDDPEINCRESLRRQFAIVIGQMQENRQKMSHSQNKSACDLLQASRGRATSTFTTNDQYDQKSTKTLANDVRSPHFNIELTVKKEHKPIENLFTEVNPVRNLTEMMYDFLADDENKDPSSMRYMR